MAGPQLGDLEPPDDRDELTADVTLVSLQGALPDAAGALVFEPPVQYTASRTRFGQGSPPSLDVADELVQGAFRCLLRCEATLVLLAALTCEGVRTDIYDELPRKPLADMPSHDPASSLMQRAPTQKPVRNALLLLRLRILHPLVGP